MIVAHSVVAEYVCCEISTLLADCCPYSSCRVFVLWNINSIQLIVAPVAVPGYVICEILTLSSWLLPIWQLPGMHFMKYQLFPTECCPYGNSRVYNLWNLNYFQLIVAHSAVADYNICKIKTLSSWLLPIWQLQGYVFCEISTLSRWFNRSVHLKQEHSSWGRYAHLNLSRSAFFKQKCSGVLTTLMRSAHLKENFI